ncbi:glycosyl transferase family 1 [Mucilaginibacter pedocola]|uniref:Glycosyl transferase family 1 n=2 Tax=Mucilaginibacter pedocola TaxID=1792845 RepID=A0A1S9PAS9_9SPHI|nr:glycosyl transferase family 1 [Mucilaginibacter pedocola]
MRKLAIVTTHPIQYYAPIFQLLAQRGNISIKVFYTWSQAADGPKNDPGFGRDVNWDIPLLNGYEYEFVENIAAEPGSHHAAGIVNPGLIDAISQWQPSALLVIGWAYRSHLAVLKHFNDKIPVLFRGDSTLLDQKPGLKSMLRLLYLRWVYSHVNYALYPGTNTKAYFEKYGLTDKQLVFAPHAVDNQRFAASRTNEAIALRQSLGIVEDEILVLFAGKLESKKSPDLLLEAFMKLNKAGVHLLIAGNGELETALKERAKAHPRIHFMGFQNQSAMPVLYQACNLFCLPSAGPNETWGLAINEAMACGKAILASNKTGCAIDLVRPGHNGEIFEAGNLQALYNSLAALCTSAEILSTLGKASLGIIANYNFSEIAEAIEATVCAGH